MTLVAGELWKPQRAPINALEYVNWRSIYSFSLTLFLDKKLFSGVLVLFVCSECWEIKSDLE